MTTDPDYLALVDNWTCPACGQTSPATDWGVRGSFLSPIGSCTCPDCGNTSPAESVSESTNDHHVSRLRHT